MQYPYLRERHLVKLGYHQHPSVNPRQITSNQTTAGFDTYISYIFWSKTQDIWCKQGFFFFLILWIKLSTRSYKDIKITFNESQHIEIYGDYYIKGGKKVQGMCPPRRSPQHGKVRSEWEPWAGRDHQRALVCEVVSSAGTKNNEKGSEKSPTYFTYSTILLFKESSPAGVCSGGFPGENFKILDSMWGRLLNTYNVIIASPGITNPGWMATLFRQGRKPTRVKAFYTEVKSTFSKYF